MDLLEVVKEYMVKQDPSLPRILADYLEEYKSDHPEFAIYHKRLISGKVRTRTLLDVCVKFGNRAVRKEAAKIGRWILKSRDTSRWAKLKMMRKNEKLNPRVLVCMDAIQARITRRRSNRKKADSA